MLDTKILVIDNDASVCETVKNYFEKEGYEVKTVNDGVFGVDSFTFNAEAEAVPYKKIIRLIEDREYLYLYVSKQSAYMVDKRTVSGGSLEDLKTFLAIETLQKWSRPANILNFRFRDLFPNTRDEYKGPRLK